MISAKTRPRLMKWGKRAAIVIAIVVVGWLIIATLIAKKKPNIAVDYIERLNAPVRALAEDEKAWPGVRAAHHGFREAVREHDMQGPADLDGLISRKLDLGFVFDVAALRDAVDKPGFGLTFSTSEMSEEDRAFFGGTITPATSTSAAILDESVLSLRLPALMLLRTDGRIVAADARREFAEGDVKTFVDDIDAILDIGYHSREGGFLIGYLVWMSIDRLGFEEVMTALAADEAAFDDEDLVALRNRVAAITGDRATINMQSERYFFDDFVQRVFTDDGNGDGVLVGGGMSPISIQQDRMVVEFLGSPLVAVFGPSRLETTTIYHSFMDAMQAQLDTPVFDTSIDPYQLDGYHLQNLTFFEKLRLFPVPLLVPALGNFVSAFADFLHERDVVLGVIELIQGKRATGEWPSELSPSLIGRYSGEPFQVVRDEKWISITTTNDFDVIVTLWTMPLK